MKLRTLATVTLVCALSFVLPGCSSFTKSGREQRAYEKYVRKSSGARQKQRAKFRSDKPKMPTQTTPSEPIESNETAPQSVPSEGSE